MVSGVLSKQVYIKSVPQPRTAVKAMVVPPQRANWTLQQCSASHSRKGKICGMSTLGENKRQGKG